MSQQSVFEKEIYVELYEDIIQDFLDLIKEDKIKIINTDKYDIFRNLSNIFFRYISKTRWYKSYFNKEILMYHIQFRYNSLTNKGYKELKQILLEKEQKQNPFLNLTKDDNNIIKDLLEDKLIEDSMDIERSEDNILNEDNNIVLFNKEITNNNKISNNIDLNIKENKKDNEEDRDSIDIKNHSPNSASKQKFNITHQDFALLKDNEIFYTEKDLSNIRRHIYVFYFNDKNTSAEYVKRILSSSYKTEELYVFEIKNIRGFKYYFVFVKFYDIVVYKKELFGINITKNPYIRAERLKDLLAYHGDLVFIKN